jgi:ubiquinol-cytochrome c reductase cytochrome b subunit
VFSVLYAWPVVERRLTRDHARHDLLDRPRDAPWRTALGAGFFTWIFVIFVAGAADRLLVDLGFPYEGQVWFFRILALVGPFLVFVFTLRICRELKASEARPLRRWEGTVVRREPDGRYVEVEASGNGAGREQQREGEPRGGHAGDG